MIIPILQIGPSGVGLQKQIAAILTMPRVGKDIVKFHRIDASDALVRSTLALDTLNDYDTLDLGRGVEARRWSQMAM